MKIVNLKAENIKRLKAVDITPNDNTVVVAGKNGQGKSSVLDSIFYALSGKSALKNTPKPIRDGQEKAEVTLDLGDYTVKRWWTANDKDYLSVTAKNGSKFSSPQSMLDKITGQLSFDPLAFANMDEKKQVEILLQVAEMDCDPRKIDEEKKTIFNHRTDVNRDLKALQARFEAMPDIPADTPDKEVSVSELLQKINAARELDKKNMDEIDKLNSLGVAYKKLTLERDELLKKIDELNKNIDDVAAQGKKQKEIVANLQQTEDFGILNDKINNAEKINKQVREKQQRSDLQKEIEVKSSEAWELTNKLNGLEEKKQSSLKNAKLPLTGLSLNDDGITYKGVPFKQCSSAEQLKISLGMAMSMNPDLRVIRIMDGSLLDKDNLKIISSMASAMDYQIWIERVDENAETGFVIEDGEVKK